MAPKFFPAISSMSLGRAWNHALEPKLAACATHGFKAIEIFYEDLEYVARSLPASHPAATAGTSFAGSSQWEEEQLAAASYIRELFVYHRMEVLCLQPFMHYDGLTDRSEHETRIQELHFWFRLADRLHTDLIQIPSNFLPSSQCTSNRKQIVADLTEVADLGLQHDPPIRFAYEALCWGTHIDLWDQAWEIIKAVDRPNFGTCLDTFNIAGRVYADPTREDGKTPNAENDMKKSIEKLRTELDPRKIFYVEVVDAERIAEPLRPGHEWYVEDQKPRMSWSRNARLFPFEKPGYLPVLDILKAICDVGYTGYISFELFNRSMNEAHPTVPEEHATRGEVSWSRLVEYMGWNVEDSEIHVKESDIDVIRSVL